MKQAMNHTTEHIIFATNFSDACHAAIPAVTRWLDAHNARLTLLHVYRPERTLHREAQSLLHSFFAEADNYRNCERHLIAGDAFDGITSFCERQERALLFMPPSDRTGLVRPFHVSTRARVIEAVDIPVWTMGQATLKSDAAVAGRNVAVWVQNFHEDREYVQAAAAHAQRHRATLHLLHIVPDTDEGTLVSSLYSDAPLGIESALDELNDLAADLPQSSKVQIHARMGPHRRELQAFLRSSEAELLMISRALALRAGIFRTSFNPMLHGCNIPIVCLPNQLKEASARVHAAMLRAASLAEREFTACSSSSVIQR